jgi:hypothetical protein
MEKILNFISGKSILMARIYMSDAKKLWVVLLQILPDLDITDIYSYFAQ